MLAPMPSRPRSRRRGRARCDVGAQRSDVAAQAELRPSVQPVHARARRHLDCSASQSRRDHSDRAPSIRARHSRPAGRRAIRPSGPGRDALRYGARLVREARQRLGAVLGDEHEVLEAAAAEARAVEARLDREHVAGDELVVAGHAEHRLLVHLEPDAVAERVEEAVSRASRPPPSCAGSDSRRPRRCRRRRRRPTCR